MKTDTGGVNPRPATPDWANGGADRRDSDQTGGGSSSTPRNTATFQKRSIDKSRQNNDGPIVVKRDVNSTLPTRLPPGRTT
ncbi:hypothetical protein LSAT2_003344 [Lamellibrachia satsuma]|nr:hypothetical protein LSAT2_003344 [Lamellibrachia satsuma]